MIKDLHVSRSSVPVRAAFVDRDGTLNVEKNYLHRYADWEWEKGSVGAIKRLKDAGLLVVVVSNQAGIARGFYTADDVNHLHAAVQDDLKSQGTSIDAFYFCQHHPDISGPCSCRKPAPGMILQAANDLNIDLAASWMVGDKLIDVEAGRVAGVKSILVRTGYGTTEEDQLKVASIPVVDSLKEATDIILREAAAQAN